MIYTFYSYKGGVGRTMALANIAELFYRAGLKVLMVDWDLEAPGLERYFPSLNSEKVLAQPGLIDMLSRYKEQMMHEGNLSKPLELENLHNYLIEVYPHRKDNGKLYLLTSGKRTPSNFANYVHTVQTFNWQEFYHVWEGELYFNWLRDQFDEIADVTLIDSRTGVTEMGGVCTYQLADLVIMLCAPNEQNLNGSYVMARNFVAKSVQELRAGRPLNVLIIPSRLERAESALLERVLKVIVKVRKRAS